MSELSWCFGGVVYQQMREKKRQDGDWDIDEKNPPPIVVVRDPPSQGRADNGCGDDGQSVDCEGLSTFFRRKRVRQNGLLRWLQSAAPEALNHAKQQQQGQ